MSQSDFADIVERAKLTPSQTIALRLYAGIDGTPLRQREISRLFNISPQAVSSTLKYAKLHIRKRCPFVAFYFPGRAKIKDRVGYNFRSKLLRRRTFMTVSEAEKIIGGTVAVGDHDRPTRNIRGYVRVACYDAFGKVLSETGRNVPEALRALIMANYKRSCEFVIKRDGYRCTNCQGFNNLQCDHVDKRSYSRTDHHSNLVTLCAACHQIRHKSRKFHLKEHTHHTGESHAGEFGHKRGRPSKEDYEALSKATDELRRLGEGTGLSRRPGEQAEST